jgi:hypothetical protein
MKVHIYRTVAPSGVEIGEVVLWENDVPVEIESITRTKDGYELTGHNVVTPKNRKVVIRPRSELLRVLPNRTQAERLARAMEDAIRGGIDGGGDYEWEVAPINDLMPLILRGSAMQAPTVTTGTVGDVVTVGQPINSQSTPSV